ncbi:hypothetical protein ES332_A02G012300v1 [Gossypium tomentosum]|uniref:Uncharacterized protein n=1 Tax=Gossypium tomentosum TaxID=34277 RepID=A0A5D2REN9_GOSTO|nr:hypothetical protein ES332_A02G012300v1 [Gossypium tomentosum]
MTNLGFHSDTNTKNSKVRRPAVACERRGTEGSGARGWGLRHKGEP